MSDDYDKDDQHDKAAELALEYAMDLFGRYTKTIGNAAELGPDLAATQAAFFKVLADEMKDPKNQKARESFQQQLIKTYVDAGLELYKEARSQRDRWESLEKKMVGKFVEAMQNLKR